MAGALLALPLAAALVFIIVEETITVAANVGASIRS